MENLQVYRVRFDTGTSVVAKSDQRPPAAQEANSAPLASAPAAPSP
jgi:soluble lytic murein transglycosylase